MSKIMKRTLSGAVAAVLLSAMGGWICALCAAPIHEAARKGDLAALSSLLNRDRSLVNERDREHEGAYEVVGKGWTPLHWAAYSGQLQAARLLWTAARTRRPGTRSASPPSTMPRKRSWSTCF